MTDPNRPPAPFALPAAEPAAGPSGVLSRLVPKGSPVGAALEGELRLPHPFSPSRVGPLDREGVYVTLYFDMMRATGGAEGVTARQVARGLGAEAHAVGFEALLEHLVTAGDVVRAGRQRYRAQPLDKRLAWHLRQALGAKPAGGAWEAFDHAVATHLVEGKQYTWHALREAFAALVESLPGWPPEVVEEARLRAERWLPRIAEVSPPAHLREDDELLLLREESRALREEVARLRAALEAPREPAGGPPDGGKKAELKRRADELTERNAELEAQVRELAEDVAALEAELDAVTPPDDAALAAAFLAGTGPGPFPESLAASERAAIRRMVLDTRARPDLQQAMVAKLGAVFRQPQAYTRLTSKAFTEASHPFDTLHRARVASYRLGYGVSHNVPTVLHIGPRENFYGTFLVRLAALAGR
ncbi:MAG: cell division protein ZapB [Candidatus Sericytochromatia bacterium]|nr:cell division protein ZapB [Candidatus Sericytochromatia bacterium]